MTEWETEGESNKGEINVPLQLRERDVVEREVFFVYFNWQVVWH